MATELKRVESASGSFGIHIFEDADHERNPGAQYAYDAAGFGDCSPDMIRRLMDMSPEERANEAGLSFHKRASFWFSFREPRGYAAVVRLQEELFSEFSALGWNKTSGQVLEISAPPYDWEAGDAMGDWFGGRKPPEKILERLHAGRFSVEIGKPDELPGFSAEEIDWLNTQVVELAARAFVLAAPVKVSFDEEEDDHES